MQAGIGGCACGTLKKEGAENIFIIRILSSCINLIVVIYSASEMCYCYLKDHMCLKPLAFLVFFYVRLHDVFRNSHLTAEYEHVELACDGIITDLAYSPNR